MFVYTTVVHDKHRIRSRILLHVVKKPINEIAERCGAEGTLDDVTSEDAIIQ
jgi:hypothetical protein